MPYKVIEYEKLRVGTIRAWGGSINTCNAVPYKSRDSMSSYAVVDTLKSGSVEGFIADQTIFHTLSINDKVFVYPGCKIARDHYRVTGYSMVRNQDAATAYVIPAQPSRYLSFLYDIATFDDCSKTLSLYKVFLYGKNKRITPDSEQYEATLESLKTYFNGTMISDSIAEKKCTLVPNKLCYKDILLDTYPNRYYVTEDNVEVKASVNINLETLDLWSRYSGDLLVKSICQSDWKQYPATLICFLSTYGYKIDYTKINDDFKFIQNHIQYNRYGSVLANLGDRIIEPDDWNLLQDWIMHIFNLESTGGFIPNEHGYDVTDDLIKLCRNKICLAPLKISSAISADTLKSMLT